jgi:8-oxo-dGTP pyrophosphatase MutT (NUDIX family)
MSISTDEIGALVEKYLAEYPDEVDRLARLTEALNRPGQPPKNLTCAAVLINPRWRVLHIHYPAEQRWLLPGGDLVATDESLPAAALRKAYEWTGIEPAIVVPLPGFEVTPIDIHVHRMTSNRAPSRFEHWHFEIRHAFQLVGSPTIRLATDDPGQPSWLTPAAVPGFTLRLKLSAIHHALAEG